MKISHIKIQQTTIININGKKTSEQIQQEVRDRNNSSINHLSIFNSNVNMMQFPTINQHIGTLSIRKSCIEMQSLGEINGKNLKYVEISYCCLSFVPKLESTSLIKLNLSHNNIEEFTLIPSPNSLKILDLRDNRLKRITSQIFHLPNLNFFHEFIPYQLLRIEKSFDFSQDFEMVEVNELLENQIFQWQNNKLIQVCEQAIDNNNDHIMNQLLSYLNDKFIRMIFEISIKKNKHSILDLLIREKRVNDLTFEERVMLLLPALIPPEILKIVPLQMIVRSLAKSNGDSLKTQTFLTYLKHQSQTQGLFISSQKDIINFLNLSIKYPHSFQAQFLLTQSVFFRQYEFTNKAIVQYFLQLDNLSLIKQLINHDKFLQSIFSADSFKHMLKPSKKIYKILHKLRKSYFEQSFKTTKTRIFPQYRQRKTFCMKNDLYDYQILKQYEELQGTYMRKDFKYTIKFFNKQNEISIAKKVGSQLRKSTIKDYQQHSRHQSTHMSTDI